MMECTTGLTDDEFDELLAWLRQEGVEGYPPILGLSGSLQATLIYLRHNIEPFSPEPMAQGPGSARWCGKNGCGVGWRAQEPHTSLCPGLLRAITPILAGPGIFLVSKAHCAGGDRKVPGRVAAHCFAGRQGSDGGDRPDPEGADAHGQGGARGVRLRGGRRPLPLLGLAQAPRSVVAVSAGARG